MSVSAYGPPPEPDAWGPALTGHPVLIEVGDDELHKRGGELDQFLFVSMFYILYKAAAAVILFSTSHLI